jgi:hypothetical protein
VSPDPAFRLPADYVERDRACYFSDEPRTAEWDDSVRITFQPDVYTLAEWIAWSTTPDVDRETILDVGCGWAEKLAAIHDRHSTWDFVGVDYGSNLARCRTSYTWGRWIEANLETQGCVDRLDRVVPYHAIVVCSDVVEHLLDPRPLLDSLAQLDRATYVFSTPERDVQHGYDHRGPSPNVHHVREWNAEEFHLLLQDHGFAVRFHGLTRGHDHGWSNIATQVAVCEVQ